MTDKKMGASLSDYLKRRARKKKPRYEAVGMTVVRAARFLQRPAQNQGVPRDRYDLFRSP